MVTRRQLLELGLTTKAIEHRLVSARLHPVVLGVYSVGRPELTQRGHWMAAVLACGPDAVLSHMSAAMLWELRPARGGDVEVSLPAGTRRKRPGIVIHRRTLLPHEITARHGIPVTSPAVVITDLAARLPRSQLERAINEADDRS